MTDPIRVSGRGSIEIDRSGFEPLIRVEHQPHWYTVDQLRQYAAHLIAVADEVTVPVKAKGS